MPYEFQNSLANPTDSAPAGINDSYPSEFNGLVAVSGNLIVANSPRVLGQVIVGGTVSGTGTLTIEHDPASLLNPPPGFLAPDTYHRRPASTRKAVLP
jgi:hypothetical protein